MGLNFFSLSIGVWRFSLYCCCILYRPSGCLFSGLMKYLHIVRHLAAKFGTFSALLIDRSSLLWMGDILMWCFPCIFVSISANYHIEMISFIKFSSCHSVFPAATQTGRGIMFYAA